MPSNLAPKQKAFKSTAARQNWSNLLEKSSRTTVLLAAANTAVSSLLKAAHSGAAGFGVSREDLHAPEGGAIQAEEHG